MTFVNFTVTRGSLQSQCLNKVLKAERPDVDSKRSDLLKLQGEFMLRLRHLEQSLLQALNEVKGRILDDDRYDEWVTGSNLTSGASCIIIYHSMSYKDSNQHSNPP